MEECVYAIYVELHFSSFFLHEEFALKGKHPGFDIFHESHSPSFQVVEKLQQL